MKFVTVPDGGLWGTATREATPPPLDRLPKFLLETLEQLPFKARQEFYRKNKKWILLELKTFRGR